MNSTFEVSSIRSVTFDAEVVQRAHVPDYVAVSREARRPGRAEQTSGRARLISRNDEVFIEPVGSGPSRYD